MMIFLGGFLNLVHGIYAGVLIALVLIGLVLYVVTRGDRPVAYRWKDFWKRAHPLSRILVMIAILVFLLRAAGTVRMGEFYIADDSAAYLVFPQKMLATHTFAADPFSERRVTSDLGAPYFLQSFVISATSLPHIAMADRGLGLVLLAAILFELGIAFRLSALQIALLEFLACLVPQETFNLTFIMLPVPILLGMVWMVWRALEQDTPASFCYSILAGVIGGAVISLKSTYLPIAGALLLIPYLVLLGRRNLKLALQLFLLAALGAVITIAAWMISMKLSSGTYLFPLLGRGLDYSRLHLFHSVPRFFTKRSIDKVVVQGVALLFLACIQVLNSVKRKEAYFSFSILLAAAIAITALNYTTGSDSIWRYNFPQFFAAIIVFYIAGASAFLYFPASKRLRVIYYFGVISLVAMIFYYDVSGSNRHPFRQIRWEFSRYKASLNAGLSGRPLSNPYLQGKYIEVENRIPKQDVALENVAYPFLFDYTNHKILVMDWPGAAAPLPGWPFGKSSVVVAQYLTKHSVRFVIYDRGYALHLDAMACQVLKNRSRYSEWLTEQVWLNTLADIQLNDLGDHYHSIYDDGEIVVIDLADPIPGSPAKDSGWTVDANVDAVCSQIARRYMSTGTGRVLGASGVE